MKTNLFAYTPAPSTPGGLVPYLSINDEGGKTTITVRTAGTGESATMEIPDNELDRLAQALAMRRLQRWVDALAERVRQLEQRTLPLMPIGGGGVAHLPPTWGGVTFLGQVSAVPAAAAIPWPGEGETVYSYADGGFVTSVPGLVGEHDLEFRPVGSTQHFTLNAADPRPCEVCGKKYDEHGTFPTCASHPYQPQAAVFATAEFAPVVPKVTEEMVNRFLGWKLPKTFGPDAGIKFAPSNGMTREEAYEKPGWWPIGTNLFTATEAREMLEHVLGVK